MSMHSRDLGHPPSGPAVGDGLGRRSWPLEPPADGSHVPAAETVERVVWATTRRGGDRPADAASWSGAWEIRQLRRVPLLALLCCWLVAAIVRAPVAELFMWLLFACAVTVSLLAVLERAIHSLRMWDERQRGRW
jgi:hypothetical protein